MKLQERPRRTKLPDITNLGSGNKRLTTEGKEREVKRLVDFADMVFIKVKDREAKTKGE